jgi:hypothetical protein
MSILYTPLLFRHIRTQAVPELDEPAPVAALFSVQTPFVKDAYAHPSVEEQRAMHVFRSAHGEPMPTTLPG